MSHRSADWQFCSCGDSAATVVVGIGWLDSEDSVGEGSLDSEDSVEIILLDSVGVGLLNNEDRVRLG